MAKAKKSTVLSILLVFSMMIHFLMGFNCYIHFDAIYSLIIWVALSAVFMICFGIGFYKHFEKKKNFSLGLAVAIYPLVNVSMQGFWMDIERIRWYYDDYDDLLGYISPNNEFWMNLDFYLAMIGLSVCVALAFALMHGVWNNKTIGIMIYLWIVAEAIRFLMPVACAVLMKLEGMRGLSFSHYWWIGGFLPYGAIIAVLVSVFLRYHKKTSNRHISLEEQLHVIKQIHDNGIITEEEYNRQREAVLAQM